MGDESNKKVEVNSFVAYNYRGGSIDLEYSNDNLLFGSLYKYGLYMRNPNHYKQRLLDLSDILYNGNGFYANVINTIKDMPIINRYIAKGTLSGVNQKKNYQIFLKSVSDKFLARNVIKDSLKDAGYYAWLDYSNEDKSNTAQITQLESRFVVITGTTGDRYRIGINVQEYMHRYSDSSFQSLPNSIQRIIRDYENKVGQEIDKRNNIENKKDPNSRKEILDKKEWYKMYPVIDLPLDRTIAMPYNASGNDIWGQFAVLKSLSQILMDEKFQDRKFNAISNAGKTVVYETYPGGDKGARNKGTTGMTDKQQGEQHDGFKGAINNMSNTTAAFVSLFPNTLVNSFEIKDAYISESSKDSVSRMALYTGFSDSILTGKEVTDKVYKELVNTLSNKAYMILDNFAKELNAIFNLMYNKYKQQDMCHMFYVHNNIINIHANHKMALELYKIGGSLEYLIANSGADPEDYMNLIIEEDANDINDLVKPRISPNNMSPEMTAALNGDKIPSTEEPKEPKDGDEVED